MSRSRTSNEKRAKWFSEARADRRKAIEASNSAEGKPVEGAQPPKREHNKQRDAILLLEECHKKLRACKWWRGNLSDCSCLHCRVERFISQNGTRL